MKNTVSLFLVFVLFFTLCSPNRAYAENTTMLEQDTFASELIEEKVFCKATVAEDFSEDRIIVVLNNSTSLMLSTYSALDFPEISCDSVIDLTNGICEMLKNQTTTRESVTEYSKMTVDSNKFHQILCITLQTPGKENVLNAIAELEKRDDLLYVSPDYFGHGDSDEVEYDEYFDEQWAIEAISLPLAWDLETGNETIYVGVMDSGISGNHPDLANMVDVSRSRFFTGGYSNALTSLSDVNGHGTHVAGIIGAQLNSTGVVGVTQNVKLVSLMIMDSELRFLYSDAINAITYAATAGISVLNLSGSGSDYSYELLYAIQNFPGTFVCSAGNDDNNNDLISRYPANFELENLISVGASNSYDEKSDFSNYGKETVDIFAPGSNILSCYPVNLCTNGRHDTRKTVHFDDGYHIISGTSMAAPYVTGVVAMMLSECPNLSPALIKSKILNSCDLRTALSDYCVSGGRINAYRALLNVHTFNYVNPNLSAHTAICDCGKTFTESHSWIKKGSLYLCGRCRYSTTIIPVPAQNITSEDDGNTLE